jgi:hypothetical protein
MKLSGSKMIEHGAKSTKLAIDFLLIGQVIVTRVTNLICTQLEFAASLEWLSLHITSCTHFQ